jgi:hypothetical protein
MTSAEAAALRDVFINGNPEVPKLDPSRLARAYAAILRPARIVSVENGSDSCNGATAASVIASAEQAAGVTRPVNRARRT